MAGNIGKTDKGVVSVSSLWADEEVYYPVDFEPYTPAHHLRRGRQERPGVSHQAEDSLGVGGVSCAQEHPFRSGGGRFVLRRGRGFQTEPKRARGELRAGFEAFARLVAQRGRDRFAVGSST